MKHSQFSVNMRRRKKYEKIILKKKNHLVYLVYLVIVHRAEEVLTTLMLDINSPFLVIILRKQCECTMDADMNEIMTYAITIRIIL